MAKRRQDGVKLGTMTKSGLQGHLARNGWIEKGSGSTDHALGQALRRYQRAFGMKADGWVGPVTHRTLTDRFCSVPDNVLAARSQWDRDQAREGLTWTTSASLTGSPRMSASDYRDVVALSLAHISTVCGARFEYTANRRTANVVMGVHRERSGGVLAWSQLPNGSGMQLDQSYDDAERWHWRDVSPAPSTIGLIHVIRHEWGHALGLGHMGDWLMRPTYDPRAHTFERVERKALIDRYGDPQDVEPEPPDPGNPGEHRKLALVVEGVFSWDIEQR